MNMLGEDPPNNVKLRQASSGFCRLWDVELVIKKGHMYLCRGWEKFYRAYDLRLGYFLLFRYDDDATMLIVKVFNATMCRMHYANDDDASNGSSSSDTGYSQSSSDTDYSESSSDSGCNKDNKEDDPDWSGGEEEEQSGHQVEDDLAMVVADQGQEMVVSDHGQELVVAEDDLAMVVPVLPEDGLAMVVVPNNDLAPVVASAIPQLGDMTTPIVVEDYIPLPPPPCRSWRIRPSKEKEKNNEN
uniref:TF-B3 domain-containing protein n=1 Tax=Triticum aestivum TaxID=4565 RepID=A0A3B5YT25_WHEAT